MFYEHSTEINAQDPEGQNTLHYACFVGHPEIIKVLLLKQIILQIQKEFWSIDF